MSDPSDYLSGIWSPAGERLSDSLRQAALNLAELLDVINAQTASVPEQAFGLEQKLNIVSEKLDRTDELLQNCVKVFGSFLKRVDALEARLDAINPPS